jgi:hypothetical protein
MTISELLYEIVTDEDKFVPLLIAGSIVLIVVVRSVAGAITASARERTRREIAAFIAEGTMTPEQGERLLRRGGSGCG